MFRAVEHTAQTSSPTTSYIPCVVPAVYIITWPDTVVVGVALAVEDQVLVGAVLVGALVEVGVGVVVVRAGVVVVRVGATMVGVGVVGVGAGVVVVGVGAVAVVESVVGIPPAM